VRERVSRPNCQVWWSENPHELLNMSVIHRRSICGVLWWKAKLSILSFFKKIR
jgi:hypothetical protein